MSGDIPPQTRLLRACYSFMVPVARFLLRSGLGYKEFAEISRAAFVDVASRDYGIRGRPTNVSRVSALTGIPRKSVSRLRKLKVAYSDSPRVELSPLSDVLQRWFTDPNYLNRNGHPKPLRFVGGRTSFSTLVADCGIDVPLGALRAELMRCGAVALDGSQRLRAQRRSVIPADENERLVTALVFGLRGLASTIAFNVSRPDLGAMGRIERFCESEILSERSISKNHSGLRKRIADFITGIDDTLATFERGQPGDGRRIGVGVFYYEDD